jgi:hypothetical protein
MFWVYYVPSTDQKKKIPPKILINTYMRKIIQKLMNIQKKFVLWLSTLIWHIANQFLKI